MENESPIEKEREFRLGSRLCSRTPWEIMIQNMQAVRIQLRHRMSPQQFQAPGCKNFTGSKTDEAFCLNPGQRRIDEQEYTLDSKEFAARFANQESGSQVIGITPVSQNPAESTDSETMIDLGYCSPAQEPPRSCPLQSRWAESPSHQKAA